ncbi:MAG: hypothetical protein M1826_003833 [Phylliscum demangeonii]|nr:MAG: hypothetical protein M1826_003833 [Phylliscum demangeonii]
MSKAKNQEADQKSRGRCGLSSWSHRRPFSDGGIGREFVSGKPPSLARRSRKMSLARSKRASVRAPTTPHGHMTGSDPGAKPAHQRHLFQGHLDRLAAGDGRWRLQGVATTRRSLERLGPDSIPVQGSGGEALLLGRGERPRAHAFISVDGPTDIMRCEGRVPTPLPSRRHDISCRIIGFSASPSSSHQYSPVEDEKTADDLADQKTLETRKPLTPVEAKEEQSESKPAVKDESKEKEESKGNDESQGHDDRKDREEDKIKYSPVEDGTGDEELDEEEEEEEEVESEYSPTEASTSSDDSEESEKVPVDSEADTDDGSSDDFSSDDDTKAKKEQSESKPADEDETKDKEESKGNDESQGNDDRKDRDEEKIKYLPIEDGAGDEELDEEEEEEEVESEYSPTEASTSGDDSEESENVPEDSEADTDDGSSEDFSSDDDTKPTPSAADLGPARANRSQLSPNGVPSPSWKPGAAELGRRDSVGLPADVADGRVGEHHPAETLPELDELALDTYYQVIHPTLPLLPNSRSRLRSRLAHCPATLREAFLDALGAVAHSSSSTTSELHRPRKAADLLAAYHETGDSKATPVEAKKEQSESKPADEDETKEKEESNGKDESKGHDDRKDRDEEKIKYLPIEDGAGDEELDEEEEEEEVESEYSPTKASTSGKPVPAATTPRSRRTFRRTAKQTRTMARQTTSHRMTTRKSPKSATRTPADSSKNTKEKSGQKKRAAGTSSGTEESVRRKKVEKDGHVNMKKTGGLTTSGSRRTAAYRKTKVHITRRRSRGFDENMVSVTAAGRGQILAAGNPVMRALKKMKSKSAIRDTKEIRQRICAILGRGHRTGGVLLGKRSFSGNSKGATGPSSASNSPNASAPRPI